MQQLYLTNCRVIDLIEDECSPFPATVIIQEGRISAIDRTSPSPPDGTRTIDLSGAYLLPGLWDVHCHPGALMPDASRATLFETEAERTLRAVRNTRAALRVGITALRALGEPNFIDVALRETYANRQPTGLWKKGYDDKRLIGPRMFCAGPAIRTTGGHGAKGRVESVYTPIALEADGPYEIMKTARYCIKMGVDWIKLAITGGISGTRESMYESQMTYEEIKAACDVAHNKGLKVTAHAGGAEAVKTGVRAGLDCIEHGYQLDEEACELMAASGVFYCPTLMVTRDEEYMRRWEWPEQSVQRALAGAEAHRRAFETALQAGVKIVKGTDAGPIADTAISEIEWLVEAGMSPTQALVASTRHAAELCDVADSLGTVKEGKLADLIAVERNPLEDITALRQVKLVMKEGEIVSGQLAR